MSGEQRVSGLRKNKMRRAQADRLARAMLQAAPNPAFRATRITATWPKSRATSTLSSRESLST